MVRIHLAQYGALAQSVEHLTFNQVVRGSNPRCFIARCEQAKLVHINFAKKEYADVAELADALDLGSSGRPCRFDSCHPHVIQNNGVWLSLARAPGLGPGGRRFESCHPDNLRV